jgi:hypothetical protein
MSVIPDPVCAKKCGACAACRRAKDGPEWWLLGPPYPDDVRAVAPAAAEPRKPPRARRGRR